jgi:hypothetical protein
LGIFDLPSQKGFKIFPYLEAAKNKNRAAKQPQTPKIPQESWGFLECIPKKSSEAGLFNVSI